MLSQKDEMTSETEIASLEPGLNLTLHLAQILLDVISHIIFICKTVLILGQPFCTPKYSADLNYPDKTNKN